MKFTDMFAYLEGYVTIQADGYFLERFLNICTRRELNIWNLQRRGAERLTADMSLASFRQIRPVCRRTRTKVRILSRCGMPFLFRRYRRRRFALIGLAAVFILLWYTSGHIMGITVFGNSRISTETILEHLARSGVELGESTHGLDSSRIRNRMMTDLDDLAWIGINVSGSRVYVEVVERLEQEQGVEMDQPSSLVATKDGEIDSVEARNGQNMVKPGDGVREGDVLVSGIMDNETQGFRYVHAYGEVYAKTRYSLSREYPLSYEEAVDTGRQTTRYTLRILDKTFPLFLSRKQPYALSACDRSEQEYRTPLEFLPSLFVEKEVWREQTKESRSRTPADARETAVEELDKELSGMITGDTEVLEREVSDTLTERGTLAVTVTLVCRENIAREVPIDPPEEENTKETE